MDRYDALNFGRLGLVALFTLFFFACSGGGGCSGCSGCGLQPIPGGYSLPDRIPNSAQARLTSSGLDFLEANAAAVVAQILPTGLRFEVTSPPDVCPRGGCFVSGEIRGLELQPEAPSTLRALGRVNLTSQNAAGMQAPLEDVCFQLGFRQCCRVEIDTSRGDRPTLGLVGNVIFEEETRAARRGYTRVRVEPGNNGSFFAPGEGIEDNDLRISGASGFNPLCTVANLGFIKNIILGQVDRQIGPQLQSAVNQQLCTRRGEFGCPAGTFSVPDENPNSTCRFANDANAECVPILLGTDGQGDFGGTLLGGFSPGTHAYAQFLLASGRSGEAVNEGMSLFMYGGLRGTDRTFATSPAHHPCVPRIEPPPLPTIPATQAFRGNTIPGTTQEAHVGIGIAESFLDYAGYGMFDSGMLCVGAGTRLSQQLSSGLISVAVMSLPDLSFPDANVPLTVAVRPQQPPDFAIGAGTADSPLVSIVVPQLNIDFYIWSTERYVRFMTLQTDLTVAVNLTVEGGQLEPTIVGVTAANPVVTNSELLAEAPATLAATLGTILSGLAGQLASSINPIALPEIMGFQLQVPAGGITRVSESGQNFLGIFANLALAPRMVVSPVETRMTIGELELDPNSMQPDQWASGRGNRVTLEFSAEGPIGVAYEYSYRIDGGPWSSWSPERQMRIDDEILLLQARHRIEGRARVAGEPASVDQTPASAELVVDILPPTVMLSRTVEGVEVDARDVITASEDLELRYRIDGMWTEWSRERRADVPFDNSDVIVEARDEAGNVGRSQAALIRGLPNSSASGGCGCSAPGGSDSTPFGWLAGLAVLGFVFVRRGRRGAGIARGRRVLPWLAVLAIASGCECSSGPDEPCEGACRPAQPPGLTSGEICCEAMQMCTDYDVLELCEPGYECPLTNVAVDATCNVTCTQCVVRPALDPGILATYLDSFVDADGSIYLSGYSPGSSAGNNSVQYGDLVFGQWTGSSVQWEVVDGAPRTPITNDPGGWRGGVSAAGDNVGRWTSLAKVGSNFVITYYDVTNGALKAAIGNRGAWSIHTVDDTGNSGRYSSLTVDAAGLPVVAYLRVQESTAMPGQVRGSVMVATATSPNPASSADWTITEVASAPMPCRAEYCARGATCLESGQCVMPTSDCAAACTGGDACFNGSCQNAIAASFVEDMPVAFGLYTSLAVIPSGGLALVFYDRTQGNVHGVRFDGSSWGAPFLIDGYARLDPFTGDSGIAADVAVDAAGTWHVAYVDGTEEILRYAQVQNGAVVRREVIDDGSTDGAAPHPDGRHIVGDDASIAVLADGTVRVGYQDATSQDAVVAVRSGNDAWARARIDVEGSTGYWIDQELQGDESTFAMWWRSRNGRMTSNGVRIVVPE